MCMDQSLHKAVFYLLIIICGLVNFSVAQQTGKIVGIITEAGTDEPMIGVNVILENKNIGAASDFDGYYSILNVHPGEYILIASMVGYKRVVVNNISVTSGKTTKIDIVMETETTDLGEEIIVTAQKPLIKKDITSSELTVTAEEIKKLPVENIIDVIKQKAGVVSDASGNIHIRGGRATEVGFLIDGISVKDNYSGNRSAEVDVQFMQEVKVISGVFNSEYGQAMSGIVEVITKRGSDKFSGNLNISAGDFFSGNKNIFHNIDDFNPVGINDFKINLSGPLKFLGNSFNYSLAFRRYENQGWLFGQRRFNPTDSSYMLRDSFVISESGDNEIVSMNEEMFYNLQAKINFDVFDNLKFSNFFLMDNNRYQIYNHDYKYNPDGLPTHFKVSFTNIANLTYLFSSSSIFTLKYSVSSTENKEYVYENIDDPNYANPELLRKLTSFAFLSGGTNMVHDKRNTITHTLKADFLSQIDRYNEFKTGFELRVDKIDVENETARFHGEIPIFSFNQFINEGKFSYSPMSFAFFVQDKIEFKSVIINAGIRFDYFNSRGKVPADYMDPENSTKTNADNQMQFSPRLGLAFPISADGTLHFSYGHFFRIPDYEYLYYNPNYRVGPGGLYTIMGNANLKAESTVSYEVGLHYNFFNTIGIEAIGFYKDISNLLGTEIKNTYIGGDRYALYVNRDYGKAKGITFSVYKRASENDHLSVSVDYTMQISESNASDPDDAFNKAQGDPPKQPNIQVVPVNWDQRHTLNLSIFYNIPENFNLGLIAKYESGFPYTPENQSIQTSFENSARMPNKVTVDLQFDKNVNFAGQLFNLYVKVYNLFDSKNEIDVYRDTGRAAYTLINQYTPEAQGPNTLGEYLINPLYYSQPRRIVIGINYSLQF